MAELSPEAMTAALQRLLPMPPTARYTLVTMTPKRPGPLLSAALRLRSLWAAASDAAGGGGRAAALAATAALALAVAALVVWRRRQARG